MQPSTTLWGLILFLLTTPIKNFWEGICMDVLPGTDLQLTSQEHLPLCIVVPVVLSYMNLTNTIFTV